MQIRGERPIAACRHVANGREYETFYAVSASGVVYWTDTPATQHLPAEELSFAEAKLWLPDHIWWSLFFQLAIANPRLVRSTVTLADVILTVGPAMAIAFMVLFMLHWLNSLVALGG